MSINHLRVTLTPDGFYPRSLRWQGRGVRVLSVDEVFTCGLERCYRVRTPEGRYELGYRTDSGAWQVRRAPLWFQRLWARVRDVPRYPLPAQRRRGRRQAMAQPAVARRETQSAATSARWLAAG